MAKTKFEKTEVHVNYVFLDQSRGLLAAENVETLEHFLKRANVPERKILTFPVPHVQLQNGHMVSAEHHGACLVDTMKMGRLLGL